MQNKEKCIERDEFNSEQNKRPDEQKLNLDRLRADVRAKFIKNQSKFAAAKARYDKQINKNCRCKIEINSDRSK